jgi:hypothetical protein
MTRQVSRRMALRRSSRIRTAMREHFRWCVYTSAPALAVAFGFLMVSAASAFADSCPNGAFRIGPSASLSDCRAYELVTPANKESTQDMFAFGAAAEKAVPAEDGDGVALETTAKLGANPGPGNSMYVFSRTDSGWQMASVHPATGSGEMQYRADLFSSNLAQVGIASSTFTNAATHSPGQSFQIGPAGGPYITIATTPINDAFRVNKPDELLGASSDFSHVVLGSTDHSLLGAATGTDEGAYDLYEWVNGQLRIVNITTGGSLVTTCGAELGFGVDVAGKHAHNAVSSDGSKIFFTSPDPHAENHSEPGCEEPTHLYMRVNGSETVDVSAPDPGVNDPNGFQSVFYEGASAGGSKVFFITKTELTPDDTFHDPEPQTGELYEYDTNTRTLTRISRGESGVADGIVEENPRSPVAISADGSTVYFTAEGQLTSDAPVAPGLKLYRYDTTNGTTRYVATVGVGSGLGTNATPVTPSGEFYLFRSAESLAGYNTEGNPELYRYDNGDRSLICVSCPPHGAPATGGATLPTFVATGTLSTPDGTPSLKPMSDDGRQVFFDTAAQLAPQDSNSTAESENPPGQDVYEWEQNGTGGCAQSEGCIHLISSGKDAAESMLLGADADGSNVFFATHAQLVPQDTDGLGDIYDARIEGGFPQPPSPPPPCASECQGSPSAPPTLMPATSELFSGSGNLAPVTPVVHKKKHKKHKKKHKKHKKKPKRHRKHTKRSRAKNSLSRRARH